MAFGKSKAKNTNRESSATLGQLQAKNPKQEFGDVFSNATELLGGLTGAVTDPFMDLIARGEETMADNPMMPLFELLGIGWQDEIDAKQPTTETPTEPQLDPYEARIQELMTNRGMTRDEAVANQASAMSAGGDINNNGAITNNEWAMKLGSDFNNDGQVSNQEFAQWKQQNPDHQAAGGTKYSGLPGQNGLFEGQAAQPQQPQVAPQQQPQQPQMSQGMPHSNGMNPDALAALEKWRQNGGSYA
jgi:hypothetical protein